MHPPPNRRELLEIVSEFLRTEVLPKLEGTTAFHTLVAANVLDIVRREISLSPAAEAAEAARLGALLNRTGPLESLNEALCDAIAAGTITEDTPGLWDHLWKTTLDTLAVDQPGYAAYRIEVARAPLTQSEETA